MFAEIKRGFDPEIFHLDEDLLRTPAIQQNLAYDPLKALSGSTGDECDTFVFNNAELNLSTQNAHVANISDEYIKTPDTRLPLRSDCVYFIGAMNAPCMEHVIGCLEVHSDKTREIDLGTNNKIKDMPYLAVRKVGGNTEIVRVAQPALVLTGQNIPDKIDLYCTACENTVEYRTPDSVLRIPF